MRNDLAKLTLDGNLGNNPELRETSSGKVLKFSLGNHVRKRARSSGEQEEHTQWFDVEVWRNAESLSKLLIKGSEVTVIGDLLVDEWEGKKGRQQRLIVRSAEVRLRGSVFAARTGFGPQPAANQTAAPKAAGLPVPAADQTASAATADNEKISSSATISAQLEDLSDLSRQLEDIDFFAE